MCIALLFGYFGVLHVVVIASVIDFAEEFIVIFIENVKNDNVIISIKSCVLSSLSM